VFEESIEHLSPRFAQANETKPDALVWLREREGLLKAALAPATATVLVNCLRVHVFHNAVLILPLLSIRSTWVRATSRRSFSGKQNNLPKSLLVPQQGFAFRWISED